MNFPSLELLCGPVSSPQPDELLPPKVSSLTLKSHSNPTIRDRDEKVTSSTFLISTEPTLSLILDRWRNSSDTNQESVF
jgi:hypothetical protein